MLLLQSSSYAICCVRYPHVMYASAWNSSIYGSIRQEINRTTSSIIRVLNTHSSDKLRRKDTCSMIPTSTENCQHSEREDTRRSSHLVLSRSRSPLAAAAAAAGGA